MAQTHYFPEDKVHFVWDNELDPVLSVSSGDTVVYRTREVSDGQISRAPQRRTSAASTGNGSTRWRAPSPSRGPSRATPSR